jgi:catechol 2,3-dioxygenase-like lactoylglutathione lyase family enzyme
MREYRMGRLLDHVHLRVIDLAASIRFYQSVLAVLGVSGESGDGWFQADELFLSEEQPPTQKLHLAFQARDHAMVERFYSRAMQAGGRDNGAPGERSYHAGYYAAFVLDPDGNNIEAVYHGPTQRSADSIVVTSE